MHIYLSLYEGPVARAAALESGGDVLAVDLVTAPAVWSEPGSDGEQTIVTPAQTVPGYWTLTATGADLWGAPAVIAEIDPDTGAAIRWTDAAIAGAVISQKWAGMADGPIALGVPVSQEEMLDAINARAAAIIAAGAPVTGGLHVALDDGSRADLGSMATTALAAAAGTIVWPESYQTGWIAVENDRIPLPTPAVGLALAAAVGDYYAQVRQRARDLKDDVLAGVTVDIDTGWPDA